MTLSSTENDFIAESDAGKIRLYLRWILDSISLIWYNATPFYEDNAATVTISNSSKQTRHASYIEFHYFALIKWTEIDQLILSAIQSTYNIANGIMNAIGH